jgi:SAM-dependent methyltransferase
VAADLRRDQLGSGRTGIVGSLLADALTSLAGAPDELPSVLDCGGGSGTFAVPLAAVGAKVTVVDISSDALATLSRRAEEGGVGARVEAIQGDVESLSDIIDGREFDLVLAHGIFEALDEPSSVFAAMVTAVRPGGLLSMLVSNPVAGVLSRALSGDVRGALAEFGELGDQSRLSPSVIHELCRQHGVAVESVHGVGVFHDLVPGAAVDVPGAREALAELEAASSTRSPFTEIATRQHLLARRPAG